MKPTSSLLTLGATLLSLSTGISFAAIGVVETTGEFNINSTTTYYSPIGANPNLPANLGTFNPGTGDNLSLDNWFFENFAFDSGGTGPTDNNWLDGTSTATLNLSIDGSSTPYALTNTGTVGNNKTWALNPGSVFDLSGLANGNHTISVSVDYTYNWWDGSNANVGTSTNNGPSSSSFDVVPEPSVSLLGGLATLFLLRRRR